MVTRIATLLALVLFLCACTQNGPPPVPTGTTKVPTSVSWRSPSTVGPTRTTQTPTPQPKDEVMVSLIAEKDVYHRGEAIVLHLTLDNPTGADAVFTATQTINGSEKRTISAEAPGKKKEDISIIVDIPTTISGDYVVAIEFSNGGAVFSPDQVSTIIRIR